MASPAFLALTQELAARRAQLAAHPVYQELTSLARVRRFMTCHSFAVWDFMSLLKRLQREVTCVELPWRPRPDAALARLINEIVVGEESDLGADGEPVSHFEMYLQAMRAAGADASPVLRLSFGTSAGEPWREVLRRVAPLPAVERFVTSTMELAMDGPLHQVAASFFFGRESVIPDMFASLSSRLERRPGEDLGPFIYYLERHVEVDGGDHGPRAEALLERLIGGDARRLAEAREAAIRALDERRALWDGILAELPRADEPARRRPMRFPVPEVLQQSFAVLEPKSDILVARFYENLLRGYPSVAKLFEGVSMARQQEMLRTALIAVVRYAQDPSSLAPVLVDLGTRHERYGVKPEHYPLVGETLLAAMAEVAGPAWTPESARAWSEAYGIIAATMLDTPTQARARA